MDENPGNRNSVEDNSNWPNFYRTLSKIGPLCIVGIDADWLAYFAEEASLTDLFWSIELYDAFFDNNHQPEIAASEALVQWLENVKKGLAEIPLIVRRGTPDECFVARSERQLLIDGLTLNVPACVIQALVSAAKM